MRFSLTIALTLLFSIFYGTLLGQAHQQFFDDLDQFLSKQVREGNVNYAGLKAEPSSLKALTEAIANIQPETLPDDGTRLAFYINSYNVLVIDAVVSAYPIDSPLSVGGFFDRQKHKVGGKMMTLDELEKGLIFPTYKDARLHFVLVCAAAACPPLIPKAYRPEMLENQIQRQTELALNDTIHVAIKDGGKKALLSELFKWYASDFKKDKGGIIDYINSFRQSPLPVDAGIDYRTYNWRLNEWKTTGTLLEPSQENLQGYTPSTLLRPGEMEIKMFNNLYSQTAFFDQDGEKQDQNSRSSFFASINSFLYGVHPRLNIGADIYIRSVRNDGPDSSPFSLFQFEGAPNSRTALSQFVPKIKWNPFASLGSLSLQTSIVIPIADDLEGQEGGPFLDAANYRWWTQIFYDRFINEQWLVYLEGGSFIRFARNDADDTEWITPLKMIWNYYPSQRWTLYIPLEFGPTWGESVISSYYTQGGLGIKYQLITGLEIEALYTRFPIGKNSGAGETFNLGFRLIR